MGSFAEKPNSLLFDLAMNSVEICSASHVATDFNKEAEIFLKPMKCETCLGLLHAPHFNDDRCMKDLPSVYRYRRIIKKCISYAG